jgi:hypothetical protein
MPEITCWFKDNEQVRSAPWLLIGKGPSLERAEDFDLSKYIRLGINHSVLNIEVEFCHVFDLSTLKDLESFLLDSDVKLIVPEYLNSSYQIPFLRGVFHRRDSRDIHELIKNDLLLETLDAQDRLFWYPFADNENAGVTAGAFSAATVTDMLAYCGVSEIRTLGVDGGADYALQLSGLETRLEAGQPSFDLQFSDIAKTLNRYELLFGPVGCQLPIKIFVGTEPEQMLAFKVLEYSILKHASVSVEVISLGEAIREKLPDYMQVVHGIDQGTPFSLQRFCIPYLAGYTGRVIYVDSDMQVFSDIRELLMWPMQDAAYCAALPRVGCARPAQLSVLLIDCERAGWKIEQIVEGLKQGDYSYAELYVQASALPAFERLLPARWNSLEYFDRQTTSLLHYTNMRDQPWLSCQNPLVRVWVEGLIEAVDEGFIDFQMVEDHVKRGWVRPSLIEQINKRQLDPMLLPNSIIEKDLKTYVPPHLYARPSWIKQATGFGDPVPATYRNFFRRGYALVRYYYVKSGLYNLLRTIKRTLVKLKRALSTGFRMGL